MNHTFGNVYEDEERARAYATLQFPGTYYLAFRDLPALIRHYNHGRRALDFGCGVRFAQAIVNRGIPVGRYVGVDVYREMIEFLTANVTDPRLEFVHLDAHNALYNPAGRPLGRKMRRASSTSP